MQIVDFSVSSARASIYFPELLCIICSQTLFLSTTYQSLFKPPFAIHWQDLSHSTPFFSLKYCPCILFCPVLSPTRGQATKKKILFCFHSFCITSASFEFVRAHRLRGLLTVPISPTIQSHISSVFLTYRLKLVSSLSAQRSQLIKALPLFLAAYILATSLFGCSSLFIVQIFLDFLSISSSSSLCHPIII